MKKEPKTFSLIPYLIQLFKIQLIIYSRYFLLIDTPGNKEPRETSPYDVFKKIINEHPEKTSKKPKNLNFLGEILYFISVQLLGILPIFALLLLGIIIIFVKVIQIGLILILSTSSTSALFLFKIYKTITLKKVNHEIIYENI